LKWGSIENNGILQKFWYLNSERRFIQRSNPLNNVARKKIWLFIGIQAFGVACTVAISQTIAAIGFPVLIIALIPIRTFLMPKWFSNHELDVLDALTATNPAVLVSFGGTPAGMTKQEGDVVHNGATGGSGSDSPSFRRQRVGSWNEA
tara:strand:- start:1815 stop:2258 length:444 start_codon:yes stop_codon:yes gene_type:complete